MPIGSGLSFTAAPSTGGAKSSKPDPAGVKELQRAIGHLRAGQHRAAAQQIADGFVIACEAGDLHTWEFLR